MTTTDPGLERLAEAVSAAFDPVERLRTAVLAAWNSQAAQAGSGGEVTHIHAEARRGGEVLLRIVADGQGAEVLLDAANARSLGRYLGRAR